MLHLCRKQPIYKLGLIGLNPVELCMDVWFVIFLNYYIILFFSYPCKFFGDFCDFNQIPPISAKFWHLYLNTRFFHTYYLYNFGWFFLNYNLHPKNLCPAKTYFLNTLCMRTLMFRILFLSIYIYPLHKSFEDLITEI